MTVLLASILSPPWLPKQRFARPRQPRRAELQFLHLGLELGETCRVFHVKRVRGAALVHRAQRAAVRQPGLEHDVSRPTSGSLEREGSASDLESLNQFPHDLVQIN